MHSEDDRLFILYSGGDGYFTDPEPYESAEAAAAEWVSRLTDPEYPGWGDKVAHRQEFVLRACEDDDDGENALTDYWDRTEVEELAKIHAARTELRTLLNTYWKTALSTLHTAEARNASPQERGVMLLLHVDRLAGSLLELLEVHSDVL